MPRDPADVAIQQLYSQEFAALAAEGGYYSGPDDLDDAEHHRISNEVLRSHLGDLYNHAAAQDGLAFNPNALPEGFAAKAREAGLTMKEMLAFARDNYDGIGDPAQLMQADLAKTRKYQEDDAKADPNRIFDPSRCNMDTGRRR